MVRTPRSGRRNHEAATSFEAGSFGALLGTRRFSLHEGY
jgi:hypothetical protein